MSEKPSHRTRLREKARNIATPPRRGKGNRCTCRPSCGIETQPRRDAMSLTWRVAMNDTTRETTKIPKNRTVKTQQSFRTRIFTAQTEWRTEPSRKLDRD